MNYYERHLGDYAKQTGHLSMLEHGAYNLLLDRYYATEKPIPVSDVYRVARAKTKAEKRAVDSVLNEFFVLNNNAWSKNRCEEVIASAQNRIAAARENGTKGGRPRKNPNGTQEKPTGLFVGSENETQQKALQSPISNLQSEDSLRGESPSVDQALYREAREIFGSSIGGQISKAIKLHGKPWVLGVIESCRRKDPEQARSYLAAALNGAKKPDESLNRRAVP